MRSRAIDVALLIGLVAVAGGIMWTLFNLGTTPRVAQPPPSTSAPQTPPAAPGPAEEGGRVPPADASAPGAVVPIEPGGGATPPTAPAVPADADGDDGDADTDGDADEPAAPPAQATPVAPPLAPDAGQPTGGAAGAPPVPAGTVAVERLGFSFVTGGPGACGMVLEAWTHVAVSRELLAEYGCGARVRVTLDEPAGGRDVFEGVIGDTMNPQFARTLNVYVGVDEPAFEYGLSSGTITPLD